MISISVLEALEKSLGTTGMDESCAMNAVNNLLFSGKAAAEDMRSDEEAETNITYAFEEMLQAIEDLDADRTKLYFGVIAKSNILGKYGDNELIGMLLVQVCMNATMRFRDAIKYHRQLLHCEAVRSEIDDMEHELLNLGIDPYTGEKTEFIEHGFSDDDKSIIESILTTYYSGYSSEHFGFAFIDTHLVKDYYDKQKLGYVYALENKAMGTVKIGKTKNPSSRIKTLKNSSGCEGECFVWGEFYNYSEVELEAHEVFSKKHHMSEWFNIDISDAKRVIKRLAEQQPKPTKEQLEFSSVIDKYNKFCSYVGIVANGGFSGIKQKVVIK